MCRISADSSVDIRIAPTEGIQLLSGDLKSLNRTEKHTGAARSQKNIRAHVLLVEDNIINRRVVFKKLETKGFIVVSTSITFPHCEM